MLIKRLTAGLIIAVICVNASAKTFTNVEGNKPQYSAPFTNLSDNDVEGYAADNWYFKTAEITGGEGIKEAKVSANEKRSYSQTIDGNYFNYVTFTIVVYGKITQHGGSGGTMPSYSLKSRRDGKLFIDPSEAVIPAGGSITFYGKEKFLNVVDPTGAKKCDWTLRVTSTNSITYKVAGEDYTPNPVYLVESTSCPITPSSNYKTPDPGSYTVKAKASPASEAEWKPATLKVVSAEFKKHASHQYGFDDYTNFTNKTKYPIRSNYTLRCTNPYISCPTNTITYTTLALNPTPITPAESDITGSSGVVVSPASITASGNVLFNTSGNGNIKSKLTGQTLNELGIYTYSLINKNCLIVLVGRPDGLGGYTYPEINSSCSMIPSTFLQCLIQANIAEPLPFPYPPHISSPYKWTSSNRTYLMNYFIANTPMPLSSFDAIQFIVYKEDIEGITGQALVPGKFSWIYTESGGSVSPHEIAHTFGADDCADNSEDYSNLMIKASQQTKLRLFQWEEIR